MRVVLAAFFLGTLSLSVAAQTAAAPAARGAAAAAQTAVKSALDLPVRKVVLYKNGVGYFEHAGSINGNQRVAIDFTSSQLNDVLQSLTVLDQGGGRVAGVNYNSTTPIEQQLKTLALGLKDYPATIAVYQALRGQRVEVTGAGSPISGRLINIEFRKETDKNGVASEDHYFLIVASDSGALRTAELTDALTVRMMDASLQKQFQDYLGIISSGQDQQVRHLALDDRGAGQRELDVSYISAVPVWKSTYRMVFPRQDNGNAIVQGWAVVDNTVGSDWTNVQLSLVAGAPQSFIQPLSQPIYTERPEVPIAVPEQSAPETHEAAEMQNGSLAAKLFAAPPSVSGSVAVNAGPAVAGLNMAGTSSGVGGNIGGGLYQRGGVYRATDALDAGDVSTKAFDDFFEYSIAQPVTIHKNESAMVPILEQELPAEEVTLWSAKERNALRAVWLENKSKLTLDAGSFSIFESGEFAGEGLLEPIHPGEKRLLSYAVDQAVSVRRAALGDSRWLHHIAIGKGTIIETTERVTDTIYNLTNAGDAARTVLLEHPRRGDNAQLDPDLKPAETTADAYRFRVKVDPHQSTGWKVVERGPMSEAIWLNPDGDQFDELAVIANYNAGLEQELRPIIDAERALSNLRTKISQLQQKQSELTADENRVRENLTALKGNDAARRFVDELNHAEDEIEAARKDQKDLEAKRDAAHAKLGDMIATLTFETDVDVRTCRGPNGVILQVGCSLGPLVPLPPK